MKKIIYVSIFLATGLLMGLAGCTDLKEKVYSDIPIDGFFNNEKDMLMYAGTAYTKLQKYPEEFSLWSLDEIASDEMVAPGRDDGMVWDNGRWDEIQKHQLKPTNKILTLAWENVYQGIASCNQIIHTIESSTLTFPAKDQVTAEIHILRAFYFYWAMDHWGNIQFAVDVTNNQLPVQKDRHFMFTYIENEILSNIDKLQDKPNLEYYGRVTQGMAYTLLAKMYLNAQEWIGIDENQKAIDACDKVIALNSYHIEDDFFANFKVHNEGSTENIFVIPMETVLTKDHFYWYTLTLNDASRATFKFLGGMWDEFILEPGFIDKYSDSDLRKKSFLVGQQKDKNGQDIIVDGEPFIYTSTVANYMARKKWEGARCCKYEYQEGLEYYTNDMENDFVLFRYTDVLYTKLEALWRLNRAEEFLSDPDLQKIRTRAGLAPLTSSDLTTTGFLDELGREFAWEGHRRQDMIRFGVWGNAGWNKPASGTNAKLFPIPQAVLDANSNLIQNPM
ncbi:MAG: RagB/SusD family nutrient uptake outer membrane protein [Bacteroidetes bacterium]|nr:RagB/SusD family nutrient uptake outer membrane protein [Bacteroidota bacterium]